MLAGAGNSRWLLVLLLSAGVTVVACVFSAAGNVRASAASGSSGHREATASVQNFEESLRMRITKKDGTHVAATGSAGGSVDGRVSFKIHTVNGSRATATFYGHNSYGTISGTGVAAYQVSGAVTRYSGRIKTLTGTGRYAHAKSGGITFSGTVNRRTYDVKMSLVGKWHA